MTDISVIIPAYGKVNILKEVLKSLELQQFSGFEVIVFDDGNEVPLQKQIGTNEFNLPIDIIRSESNVGPAIGRNAAAEHAKGDAVLFIGADCFAHKDMVSWHYINHMYDKQIVQGYTPWHPDVISRVTEFVDATGLQSAWQNLMNEDGSWKREISPAFCLTTNYSINKQLFLNERFDESFSGAAWEDVELGYRLARYGNSLNAVMEPRAMNYHYHRYSMDSFFNRCRMEGYHRITLCKKHPEMAWDLINPYDLRTARDADEGELFKTAHELDYVNLSNIENEQIRVLRDIKYKRLHEVCRAFSLKGVVDRIADEHPAMQALINLHRAESVIQVLSGVQAINDGNLGYAMHTAQWLVSERNDDWSAYCYLGEIEIEAGNLDEAFMSFQKSLTINPGNKWAKGRVEWLRERTW